MCIYPFLYREATKKRWHMDKKAIRSSFLINSLQVRLSIEKSGLWSLESSALHASGLEASLRPNKINSLCWTYSLGVQMEM